MSVEKNCGFQSGYFDIVGYYSLETTITVLVFDIFVIWKNDPQFHAHPNLHPVKNRNGEPQTQQSEILAPKIFKYSKLRLGSSANQWNL